MLELINSRKMILLVLGLAGLCVVIIVLEGLFADDQSWHPLFPAQGHRWQPHKTLPESKDVVVPISAGSNNPTAVANQSHKQSAPMENKEKLESTAFCWLHEPHVLVEQCSKCTEKDLRDHVEACTNTGYKERIRCQSTGLIMRSCVATAPSTSQFSLFHLSMLFLSGFGYVMIGLRRKQLDAKMYEKFRRQLQSGV
jgi:hypothetical protein